MVLDIRRERDVVDVLKLCEGGMVVSFAAYTDVNGAERQRDNENGTAWQVNVVGAQNVARACDDYHISLVHLGTDFVFPGTEGYQGPYSEGSFPTMHPDEISWYGWTKLLGEAGVQALNPSATIVRICYPYGADRHPKLDFAREIIDKFDNGTLHPFFSNQVFTPTFIPDVTKAIMKIFEQGMEGQIFHVASPTKCTPLQFGPRLLQRARNYPGPIQGSDFDAHLKSVVAPRPKHGGLDSAHTRATLGMNFHTWEEGIEELAQSLYREQDWLPKLDEPVEIIPE